MSRIMQDTDKEASLPPLKLPSKAANTLEVSLNDVSLFRGYQSDLRKLQRITVIITYLNLMQVEYSFQSFSLW